MGQKRSRSVGRRVWQLLEHLPRPWKKWLIRKLLPVPSQRVPALQFKQAETYEEIESALNLVYEGYVERGLVDANSARLRLTKYHALPTSPILIAKQGDEVVGTLTLILDSPLGLPLEGLWDLARFRQRYRRPAEVSSLAIKKSFRAKRGEILFPLCKFMYMFAKHHLGVDLLLAAVSPSVQEFYRSILLFNPIDHRVLTYAFARGAKATGLYLPLDGTEDTLWGNEYQSEGPQDYYSYFIDSHTPHFQFPERKYGETGKVILSPGLLEYLFRYCSDILDQLTTEERLALSNFYRNPDYDRIIRIAEVPGPGRQAPRYSVLNPCLISRSNQPERITGSILDVSRTGVRIHTYQHHEFRVGHAITMKVQLNPRESIEARARIAWSSAERRMVGVMIEGEVPTEFQNLIDHLESHLNQVIDEGLPLAVRRLAS